MKFNYKEDIAWGIHQRKYLRAALVVQPASKPRIILVNVSQLRCQWKWLPVQTWKRPGLRIRQGWKECINASGRVSASRCNRRWRNLPARRPQTEGSSCDLVRESELSAKSRRAAQMTTVFLSPDTDWRKWFRQEIDQESSLVSQPTRITYSL